MFKIKEIKVDNLLKLGNNLLWKPTETVNVLSGRNGTGKSKLLDLIYNLLIYKDSSVISRFCDKISIKIENILSKETIRFSNADCQKEIPNFSLFYLKETEEDYATRIYQYIQLIDWVSVNETLIPAMNKILNNYHIEADRYKQTLFLKRDDKKYELKDYLTLGQQRYLLMLLAAQYQAQSCDNGLMLLDLPENGLHIDIQRDLFITLYSINEKLQIFCVTHSPGMILNGWQGFVNEITDLYNVER